LSYIYFISTFTGVVSSVRIAMF